MRQHVSLHNLEREEKKKRLMPTTQNTHTGRGAGQIFHDVKTCYCCWVELKNKSVKRNTKEMRGEADVTQVEKQRGTDPFRGEGGDKTCGKGHWFKAWTWTSWTDLMCTQLKRESVTSWSLLHTDQVRLLPSLSVDTQTTRETIWGEEWAVCEELLHLPPEPRLRNKIKIKEMNIILSFELFSKPVRIYCRPTRPPCGTPKKKKKKQTLTLHQKQRFQILLCSKHLRLRLNA